MFELDSSAIDNQGYTLFAAFDGLFTRLEGEYDGLNQLLTTTNFELPSWADVVNIVNLSQKLIVCIFYTLNISTIDMIIITKN